MANQWFKFYGSEYLSDPKILQLNGDERSCWVTLLALASQTKDGVIKFLSENQLLAMSGVIDKKGILEKFEKLDMIERCNGNVTVKHWLKRQLNESTLRVREFRMKQKSNASETTEENRIERKNRKENKESVDDLPSWLDLEAWASWVQHRADIRKKLTPQSVKLQLKLLGENIPTHRKIIETSIQNGWTGLFPIKGDTKRPDAPKEPNKYKNVKVTEV